MKKIYHMHRMQDKNYLILQAEKCKNFSEKTFISLASSPFQNAITSPTYYDSISLQIINETQLAIPLKEV